LLHGFLPCLSLAFAAGALLLALALPHAAATLSPRMRALSAGAGAAEGSAREPGQPPEILSWRHQMLDSATYRDLARQWEDYVRSHPDDARALVEWGDALRYAGHHKDGVAKYAQAFAVDSSNAAAIGAHVFFSACHAEGGEWELAHARLLRAVEDDPDYPDIYYTLCLTAMRSGDDELAAECLRRVVALGDMPRPLLDWGRNMVVGAPDDAIIFTNGDNDTYPPLAYQAITGDRMDVAIVNLSLLNTPWFVRYCRDRGLPVTLTDEEIADLHVGRRGFLTGELQRHILRNVEQAADPKPLYYAVTVNTENKALPRSLVMEGLLERIVPQGKETELGTGGYNWTRSRELFDTVYRLDSALDPYLDWEREAAVGMVTRNYAALLIRLGEWLVASEARSEAEPYLYRAAELLTFHGDRQRSQDLLAWWAREIPQGRLLAPARGLFTLWNEEY
jgi:tetratricopeptide (TPR) repeat protein